MAPRKIGRVMEVIRGKQAVEALALLQLMPQKGARIIAKVLKSAIANATNNFKLAKEELVVDQAFANKGIVMKRWKAKSRGRAGSIMKRTSHVTVLLESKEPVLKEAKS